MIDIFHPNFIHKQMIKTILSEQWNTSNHWVELFLNNLPVYENVLPKIFLYGNRGFCCIRKDQGQVQLSGLYVLEKYRNQGIANSLIDFSKSYCKKLRIKTLYLETVDKEEYYIKRGWKTYNKRVFPASGNILKQMSIDL